MQCVDIVSVVLQTRVLDLEWDGFLHLNSCSAMKRSGSFGTNLSITLHGCENKTGQCHALEEPIGGNPLEER